MNDSKSFLGRGWKFPIEVDAKSGKIKTAAYEEDIQEAIRIILRTKKGERVMRPDFGCNIHDYVFSIPDYTTLNLMESEIRQALVNWEPRIEDVDVKVYVDEEEPQKLLINIAYVVRSTNNPFNLVYPFYLREGIGK